MATRNSTPRNNQVISIDTTNRGHVLMKTIGTPFHCSTMDSETCQDGATIYQIGIGLRTSIRKVITTCSTEETGTWIGSRATKTCQREQQLACRRTLADYPLRDYH